MLRELFYTKRWGWAVFVGRWDREQMAGRQPFRFYRPDDVCSSYQILWGRLEALIETPATGAKRRSAKGANGLA